MEKRGARKGQVAIFLIAAAVIILGGLAYFVYRTEIFGPKEEIIQPEAMPIKQFIDGCIKQSLEDGLAMLGATGGYVDVPQSISMNPKSYFSSFSGGIRMPYWYNDGQLKIRTESDVSAALAKHIDEQAKECIISFENTGYSLDIVSPLKSKVTLNENDMTVDSQYRIEAVSVGGDFRTLLERSSYTHPLRLKKILELAALVMQRQHDDEFMERKTIDLMSMATDVPITDYGVSCTRKTWQLFDIKNRIQELLQVNVPFIRVYGTDYNPGSYVPVPDKESIYSRSYYQHHYLMQVADDTSRFKDFKVAFLYDNIPLEIYARPSEDGVLKSSQQKGSNAISFLCMQTWHFTYDIKYPMTATIIDKGTRNILPYAFSFAFEVDIDHNIPSRANRGTEQSMIVPEITDEEYCSDVRNEITVFTIDNSTVMDLRDVNLTFACGRFYCDMGTSDSLSFGAAAGVTKRLPFCVNAVIRGKKEWYLESYTFAQTDIDGKSYILFMNPLAQLEVSVVKHHYSTSSQSELEEGETVSIYFKEINGSSEAFAQFPSGRKLELPYNKDTNYEVSAYLSKDETLLGAYHGKMKIPKGSLEGASKIKVHVIDRGVAAEEEMFTFVAELERNSKNIPAPEIG
jgi:hypothetical protein